MIPLLAPRMVDDVCLPPSEGRKLNEPSMFTSFTHTGTPGSMTFPFRIPTWRSVLGQLACSVEVCLLDGSCDVAV